MLPKTIPNAEEAGGAGRRPPGALAADLPLVAVAVATAAGVVASAWSPVLAVLPVLLAGLGWLLLRTPLRWTVWGLLVALLAIDDHLDADRQWRTPLAVVGDLLHGRVDQVIGGTWLSVSGMEIALLCLAALWIHRKLTLSAVDGPVPVRPPKVLRDFVILYLAGVLLAEAIGLARGLPAAPWKVRNLLHPLLLLPVGLLAWRDTRDNAALGRIVVFSAVARAVLAIVVQQIAIAETGGPWVRATSHGDSVLFSVAVFLLVVDWVERPTRGRFLRAALLLPVILRGAADNQRRIFWVMLGIMLVMAYVLSPRRRWKAWLTRALLVTAPVVALYVGVGWDRGTGVFGPVRTLRSVVDTSADHSAYWREVENWNIAMSMRASPFLGTGLGGEYVEHMKNDDISGGFKEYREWPHNTVLGLLLLMGLAGATTTMALLALTVFLGARALRHATSHDQRVAALGSLGAAAACLVIAWGDTGAHFPQYKIFLALAVAVSARLAVLTGAWPGRDAGAQLAARPLDR